MFNDPPPQLVSFLQSRGVSSETWIGTNKSMQYLEEVLAPGDSLYAIGPSHREAGPPAPDAYRDAPASRLVMIEERGHYSYRRHCQEWNRIIDAFLRDAEAGGT